MGPTRLLNIYAWNSGAVFESLCNFQSYRDEMSFHRIGASVCSWFSDASLVLMHRDRLGREYPGQVAKPWVWMEDLLADLLGLIYPKRLTLIDNESVWNVCIYHQSSTTIWQLSTIIVNQRVILSRKDPGSDYDSDDQVSRDSFCPWPTNHPIVNIITRETSHFRCVHHFWTTPI